MEMPSMRGTQTEEQVGPGPLPLLRRPEIPICTGGRGLILKTIKNYNKIFLATQDTLVPRFPLEARGPVPSSLKKYFLKKNDPRRTAKGTSPPTKTD
jgi:hypothetical protein